MYVLLCPSDGSRPRGRSAPAFSFGGGPTLTPDVTTTSYAACYHDDEAPIDVKNNGVFFLNSRVRSEEIEDGLAHTIFAGEKRTPGDELGWVSGTRATLRNTGTPINQSKLDPADLSPFLIELAERERPANPEVPAPDPDQVPTAPRLPGATVPVGGYGSFHASGSNFLFGDGSVRNIRSNINTQVYRLLGNRLDGQPVSADQL